MSGYEGRLCPKVLLPEYAIRGVSSWVTRTSYQPGGGVGGYPGRSVLLKSIVLFRRPSVFATILAAAVLECQLMSVPVQTERHPLTRRKDQAKATISDATKTGRLGPY